MLKDKLDTNKKWRYFLEIFLGYKESNGMKTQVGQI